MKKAIGQTVRELKRGVNKNVLKVPGIEQKVLDATSNEPWGPHGSLLADIAHATRNYQEYQIIMSVVWKRINDTGKNWRHVYKALTVLEYLVAHGSERVIDEIREHAYQISTLSDFQYLDHNGRDQGNNVRRKSQTLVSLVNDKERIQEVREKALANKDKYRSANSTDGAFRSGSSHGGYGDRYDDDRSEGRYGSRDEERNGYGRERDGGYRDDDRYGRGGDSYNRDRERYGRDSDEQYGRDNYQDDSYRGGRGNDDQFGSGNRNYDGDRARSFDEDDRYASRAGRADDSFQHESIERRLERKLSEQITRTPPSYEEAIRDKPDSEHSESSRDGGVAVAQTSKAYSPPAYKAAPPENTSQVRNHVAGVPTSTQNKEADDFDEFDPRGFVAGPPVSSTSQPDLFGDEASDLVNSLALVPVTSFASSSEADMPTNSGYGTTFVAESSTSTSMNQFNEDPFGAAPFKAAPQEGFPAQQQNFAPATSFQSSLGHSSGSGSLHPVAPQMETSPSFGFGDPLGGLTYAPAVANNQDSSANGYAASSQQSYANPALLASQSPATHVSSGFPSGTFPQAVAAPSVYSGGTQPTGQIGLHTPNMNFPQQSGVTRPISPANLPQQPVPLAFQMALTTTGESAAKTQPKDKFETKSTVWADTLNRGLVNLNISGSKINPLADIGIDFDSINRLEKRKHEKNSPALATSTVTMGKAMGAGSGIGRAATTGVAPPSNPMMGRGMSGASGMGMGMGGYGGGMNRPMGMGMGMNPGMGLGMNMGMSQGTPMQPGIRMPGVGYNPMAGMGGYGQQQYGGGNR